MFEPSGRRLHRFAILAIVAALHVALIALLLAARVPPASAPVAASIEVIVLPAVSKLRAESLLPRFLSVPIVAGLAPPTLIASPTAGTGPGPEGAGGAINWAAEAGRAVNAFEIRRDRPTTLPVESSSPWAGWSPHGRPGERVRTDSGDWIVWIDANCYQIARWHASPANPAESAEPAEPAPKVYCEPSSPATEK